MTAERPEGYRRALKSKGELLMKVGFGYLDGLTITVSEEMEPRSWFIYDRDGRIIQTGMAGFGALTHDDVAIPVRATVGRSVWEALQRASTPSP